MLGCHSEERSDEESLNEVSLKKNLNTFYEILLSAQNDINAVCAKFLKNGMVRTIPYGDR